MTKVNKLVEQWAIERGLVAHEAAVPVAYNGYDFSVGYVSNYGLAITVLLQEKKLDRTIVRALQKALRGKGTLYLAADAIPRMQFAFKKAGKGQMSQRIDESIALFADALRANGVQSKSSCSYCGKENPDSSMEIPEAAIIQPVHTACKEQEFQKIEAEIMENETNGNYILGTIGAIVGAIAGYLPTFIAMIFFNFMSGYLYILIPLGALAGYRIARGKANIYMKLLITVVSFVAVVVLYFISLYTFPYYGLYQEYNVAQRIVDGKTTISAQRDKYPDIAEYVDSYPYMIDAMEEEGIGNRLTFGNFMKFIPLKEYYDGFDLADITNIVLTDPQLRVDVILDLAFSLIFVLIGVVVVWRVGGTNSGKRKKLERMRQTQSTFATGGGGVPPQNTGASPPTGGSYNANPVPMMPSSAPPLVPPVTPPPMIVTPEVAGQTLGNESIFDKAPEFNVQPSTPPNSAELFGTDETK